MRNLSNYLILLIILMSSSCAMLESRDFEDQMDPFKNQEGMFTPNQDFVVVPGDDGRFYRSDNEITRRTPATASMRDQDIHQNSLKREVIRLENKMDDAEYHEYIKIRDKIGGDSEKIYYLGLSPYQRKEYLAIKQIEAPRYYTVNESNYASVTHDVILGMRKEDVVRSWGIPDRKDYSGDPRYENERWAYSRNGKVKYIYFEGGVVGGWNEQ